MGTKTEMNKNLEDIGKEDASPVNKENKQPKRKQKVGKSVARDAPPSKKAKVNMNK